MKVLTCLVCMIALIMTVIAGFIFFSPDPLAANGGAGNPGVQGEAGVQGEKGDKGDPGVGIVKVEIVNGEFVITYTDGNVVNLGPLVVEQGTPGLDYYPLPNGTLGVKPGTALYMEEIVIPATYNGLAVTEILPQSFSGSTNLKQIHLSDSVTSIGHDAFRDCTALTSVNFGNGVTSIGNGAFYDCSGLTSIEIPDSVTSIGAWAFYGCQSLTSIDIPDSVTSIGDYAFAYCVNLRSISFAGTVDQWNAITKGLAWNQLVPATEVICSDGTVPLN